MTRKEGRRHNTGLAKVTVQYSASTFVLKIATFAKPETFLVHPFPFLVKLFFFV
jgi:hypothetical protein